MTNVVLPFPTAEEIADLHLKRLIGEASREAGLSEFARTELERLLHAALRPLSGARLSIDVPAALAEHAAALDSVLAQACERYVAIFTKSLATAVKRHVNLIEDLRKQGISVQSPNTL